MVRWEDWEQVHFLANQSTFHRSNYLGITRMMATSTPYEETRTIKDSVSQNAYQHVNRCVINLIVSVQVIKHQITDVQPRVLFQAVHHKFRRFLNCTIFPLKHVMFHIPQPASEVLSAMGRYVKCLTLPLTICSTPPTTSLTTCRASINRTVVWSRATVPCRRTEAPFWRRLSQTLVPTILSTRGT